MAGASSRSNTSRRRREVSATDNGKPLRSINLNCLFSNTEFTMPSNVTVTCPECGAKLKLKGRASLGKTRPCPKCEVPFVPSEEHNEDVYDLDARGAESRSPADADSEQRMLKRSGSGRGYKGNRQSQFARDIHKRPLVIGIGAAALISVGVFVTSSFMRHDDQPVPDRPSPNAGAVNDTPNGDGSAPRVGQTREPVDLIAAVDIGRDVVRGKWGVNTNWLQSQGGDSSLQFPVEPSGSYGLEATFAREADTEQISVILPVGNSRQVMLVVDGHATGICGLEAVNDQSPGEENRSQSQFPIENDQHYVVHADVRRHNGNVHIQAGIDGKELIDWTGPASQLSIAETWAMPSKNAVGLASGSGNGGGTWVTFRNVRLMTIDGSSESGGNQLLASSLSPKATLTEPDGPATQPLPQPSPSLPESSPPESLPPTVPFEVASSVPVEFDPDLVTYDGVIHPFFQRHCNKCHGPDKQEGGFRFDEGPPNEFVTQSVVERWSGVRDMLNSGEMPPEGEARPKTADASRVIEWIEHEQRRGERSRNTGSVTLRRMNREEYGNTIRDLVGIDFRAVEKFPEDPPSDGFDNVGSALTISPTHMELYLNAAQKIIERAIPSGPRPPSVKWRYPMAERIGASGDGIFVARKDASGNDMRMYSGAHVTRARNGIAVLERGATDGVCVVGIGKPTFDGDYIVRVRAAQWQPTRQEIIEAGVKLRGEDLRKHLETDRAYHYGPPRLKIVATSTSDILTTVDVDASEESPEVYETRVRFPRKLPAPGDAIRISNVYLVDNMAYHVFANPHFPKPRILVDWIEFEGPVFEQWPPATQERILFKSPNSRNDKTYAKEVLTRFMTRACRRPVTDEEVEHRLKLFRQVRPQKPKFKEAIKVPLIAVLTSPTFLYLVEEPGDGSEAMSPTRLDNYEFASRLSYFLWPSMPDDELFQLAAEGRLNDPQVLTAQVDRMLADEKSQAFSKNFASQWLGLRTVGRNPPARDYFPRYDDHVHESIVRETLGFFRHVLQNDRPVTDFIKSDDVTINERLARYYGIPGVRGDHIRVVPAPAAAKRGGLLTQASILSVTSNGTRTSPVRRGVWILENILGDHVPPPPPNAGDIPPAKEDLTRTSVRERLQAHRNHAQCVRCHRKIDPLGFALEHYNGASFSDSTGTLTGLT